MRDETPMTSWRTAIATSDETGLWIRGYDIRDLMRKATFTDLVFLLHQSRLPRPEERALLDAILISVADHGAGAPSCATARLVASGNRESLAAAVGAGILAVGNDHGGAGAACIEMLARGLEEARRDNLTLGEKAERMVAEAAARKERLPGLGHRVHSTDPRVSVLFAMAEGAGFGGQGIRLIQEIEIALRKTGRNVPINVDGALAAVLFEMGFPPAAGKLLFIVGRVAGLSAEVAEEYAREKPMRIRFDVAYDGPPPRQID